jgi:hypothetical protein
MKKQQSQLQLYKVAWICGAICPKIYVWWRKNMLFILQSTILSRTSVLIITIHALSFKILFRAVIPPPHTSSRRGT